MLIQRIANPESSTHRADEEEKTRKTEQDPEAERRQVAELQKRLQKAEAELQELLRRDEMQQSELAKAMAVIKREAGENANVELVFANDL